MPYEQPPAPQTTHRRTGRRRLRGRFATCLPFALRTDVEIGGLRLDIGEPATCRPGARPSEGLRPSRAFAAALSDRPVLADRLSFPTVGP